MLWLLRGGVAQQQKLEEIEKKSHYQVTVNGKTQRGTIGSKKKEQKTGRATKRKKT